MFLIFSVTSNASENIKLLIKNARLAQHYGMRQLFANAVLFNVIRGMTFFLLIKSSYAAASTWTLECETLIHLKIKILGYKAQVEYFCAR